VDLFPVWLLKLSRSGSSNKKDTAGNLSAEVSGRTKTGVTGKASINASGNKNKSGTGGGGSLGLGYRL
jgi:hypothetical protein